MTDHTLPHPFKVLFLCAGGSARSVIAERIMNRVGNGRFDAFSAGPTPDPRVHPEAAALLARHGYDVSRTRTQAWQAFCGPEAPALDFVITLCDRTARQSSPFWDGEPITSHWSMADPAASGAPQIAFSETYRQLADRIDAFVNLPFRSLGRRSLQQRLDAIGAAVPEQAVA